MGSQIWRYLEDFWRYWVICKKKFVKLKQNCSFSRKNFRDRWPSLLTNIDRNDENRFVENQGPNKGWNYPDALFVGKGGMTFTEYKTMFALWCVVKSPLMLGSDLRNMTIEDEAYKVTFFDFTKYIL